HRAAVTRQPGTAACRLGLELHRERVAALAALSHLAESHFWTDLHPKAERLEPAEDPLERAAVIDLGDPRLGDAREGEAALDMDLVGRAVEGILVVEEVPHV